MWKLMRYGCGGLLMCFAALQLNDPDPVLWVLAYGVAAVLTVLSFKNFVYLRIGMGLLYLVLAVWLFPETYYGVGEMVVEKPEVEQARESLGMMVSGILILCGVWLHHKEKISK